MAREATARLYDVQESSVVLKKFREKAKYDQGAITFRARKGRLIDLDKLHESVWATRLSGGTRSGLVSLEVTVIGEPVFRGSEAILRVTGSEGHFVLAKSREDDKTDQLAKLRAAVKSGQKLFSVTGRLDGWAGRWPDVLRKLPPKPRKILVTGFKTSNESESTQRANRRKR